MSYHRLPPSASRPLLIAPYHARAGGVLFPQLPAVCAAHGADARDCRIAVHHLRPRATGPGFPLVVAQCRTHRLVFTLYPPGHVPYGRSPVIPVTVDGKRIQRQPAAPGAEGLRGTIFDAALDGAAGRQWARMDDEGSKLWWNTQVRHQARIERWLGLSPAQSPSLREQLATALGVPLFDLGNGAAAIAAAPGYRSRGTAAVAVLQVMTAQPCLLERLLRAGELAGLWGTPWFWDSGCGVWRCLAAAGNR